MKLQNPDTKLMAAAILIGVSLCGCASTYDEDYYANKDCQQIREYAKQKLRTNKSNIIGTSNNYDEPNDILGAIFQSDEQKEKVARNKAYNKKCQ